MADTPMLSPNGNDLFGEVSRHATEQFWKESVHLGADGPPPTDGLVHHYTTIDAAISIIQSNKLWSSNIAYLNDITERLCAQSILHGLPEFGERVRADANAKELLTKLEERIATKFLHSTFVVSFCNNGDSLGQWRGYGGGVSIAFDSTEFNDAFENTNLYKVVYDAGLQTSILDSLTMSFSTYLDNQKHRAEYQNIEERALSLLHTYFENISAKMKNIAFEEEDEWRVVTTRGDIHLSDPPEVEFRMKSNGVVPYIKLHSKNGLLPIKGITLAPNAHWSAESTLSLLLGKNGYKDSFVQRSIIPFRD